MNTSTGGIKLSPLVRTLIAAVIAGATAALTLLNDGVQVQDVIVILLAALGAFGIVPGQVGGTQHGVVNPAVTEPPAANIHESGEVGATLVEMAFAICLLLIGIGVLVFLA